MFCLGVCDVSKELGIPTYVFYTSGAAMLANLFYLMELDKKHACDFRDLKGFMEIPGRLSVSASTMLGPIQEKNNPTYRWFLRASELYSEVDRVLINTFRELQPRPIKALLEGLCKPGQPPASVVFLCFGSMGAFLPEQIAEIAHGLERSAQRFLWSMRVRPNSASRFSEPKDADPREVLPEGFLERTEEKGLVWPKWAPQLAILSHPAIGGFVSHCGWNSTLESVWFGVPMIAWPLYAEQGMNAFELVNDLGLCLGLKDEVVGGSGLVKGEELEKAVRKLMEGEEGKEVREKMKEAKNLARKATEERGSSYSTLAALIQLWTNGQ